MAIFCLSASANPVTVRDPSPSWYSSWIRPVIEKPVLKVFELQLKSWQRRLVKLLGTLSDSSFLGTHSSTLLSAHDEFARLPNEHIEKIVETYRTQKEAYESGRRLTREELDKYLRAEAFLRASGLLDWVNEAGTKESQDIQSSPAISPDQMPQFISLPTAAAPAASGAEPAESSTVPSSPFTEIDWEYLKKKYPDIFTNIRCNQLKSIRLTREMLRIPVLELADLILKELNNIPAPNTTDITAHQLNRLHMKSIPEKRVVILMVQTLKSEFIPVQIAIFWDLGSCLSESPELIRKSNIILEACRGRASTHPLNINPVEVVHFDVRLPNGARNFDDAAKTLSSLGARQRNVDSFTIDVAVKALGVAEEHVEKPGELTFYFIVHHYTNELAGIVRLLEEKQFHCVIVVFGAVHPATTIGRERIVQLSQDYFTQEPQKRLAEGSWFLGEIDWPGILNAYPGLFRPELLANLQTEFPTTEALMCSDFPGLISESVASVNSLEAHSISQVLRATYCPDHPHVFLIVSEKNELPEPMRAALDVIPNKTGMTVCFENGQPGLLPGLLPVKTCSFDSLASGMALFEAVPPKGSKNPLFYFIVENFKPYMKFMLQKAKRSGLRCIVVTLDSVSNTTQTELAREIGAFQVLRWPSDFVRETIKPITRAEFSELAAAALQTRVTPAPPAQAALAAAPAPQAPVVPSAPPAAPAAAAAALQTRVMPAPQAAAVPVPTEFNALLIRFLKCISVLAQRNPIHTSDSVLRSLIGTNFFNTTREQRMLATQLASNHRFVELGGGGGKEWIRLLPAGIEYLNNAQRSAVESAPQAPVVPSAPPAAPAAAAALQTRVVPELPPPALKEYWNSSDNDADVDLHPILVSSLLNLVINIPNISETTLADFITILRTILTEQGMLQELVLPTRAEPYSIRLTQFTDQQSVDRFLEILNKKRLPAGIATFNTFTEEVINQSWDMK